MTDVKNLPICSDQVILKPVYFTFEPPQPPPEYLGQYGETLSVEDIAEITGLSKQTVRTELENGSLPGCRIGRQWIVAKPAFVSYLFGRWS